MFRTTSRKMQEAQSGDGYKEKETEKEREKCLFPGVDHAKYNDILEDQVVPRRGRRR